jgi:serine protease AprX
MFSPTAVVSALLTGALMLSPTLAFAKPGHDHVKVDRALRASLLKGHATETVIISVKPGYRDALRKALQDHGDVITEEHPLIEAISVVLHSGDVDEIAKQPWVEAVSANAFVYATASTQQSGSTGTQSQSTQIAPIAGNTLRDTLGLPHIAIPWVMTSGSGVTVAIVDSGIAPSDDFAGRIVGFYDFTKHGRPVAPFDDYGHGTHIAGLIGSSGRASNNGRGRTSDVINALEYITANRARLGVKIINLSLGHPIYAPAKYDPLVQAVEKASAAGLIVVTAAGNNGQKPTTGESGYTGVTSPGNAPSAITAGAVKTQDTISRLDDVVAAFSSRGPTWFDAYPKPDVVAPGHQLASDTTLTSYLYKLLNLNRGKSKNGSPVLKLSGTSMATGVTSGVVALMLQAHNQNGFRNAPLTPNLAKAILQYSAIALPGADVFTQGAGEINAAGAIALARAIDTDVRQGANWLGTGVTAASVIGGRTYGWSQHVIWGDRVLSGNVVYVSNIIWSSNILWGTNASFARSVQLDAADIVWGTTILWGSNLVWPDRIIGQSDDGDNIVWGTSDGDNIVWGTLDGDNIVWGTSDGDNIVWGTWDGDNIVWGTSDGDNIVWGTSDGDNIVWGTSDNGDNIVWGTVAALSKGKLF